VVEARTLKATYRLDFILVPVRVAIASASTVVGIGQIWMLLLFFVVGLVILVVYDPLGFVVVWFWIFFFFCFFFSGSIVFIN
jgi:hypothetical protein